jgi:CRP/FNR family transcriptional regulator, cyclic AMP receptor protein
LWRETFDITKSWLINSLTAAKKDLLGILLLFAHFGKEDTAETVILKISQETLAEMVGTTRSQVCFL